MILLLLPLLALGPAVGGISAWVHVHGEAGTHLHLFASGEHHGSSAHHDWHATQHSDAHDAATADDDEPAPGGLIVELPEELAQSVDAPTRPRFAADASVATLLPIPSPVPRVACGARTLHARFDLPPRQAVRSGVAVLLRSSHAILN